MNLVKKIAVMTIIYFALFELSFFIVKRLPPNYTTVACLVVFFLGTLYSTICNFIERRTAKNKTDVTAYAIKALENPGQEIIIYECSNNGTTLKFYVKAVKA